MTVQEAIKELQVGYLGDTEEIVQAKHMGIKALEKQIPKKVLYRKEHYGSPWHCPICEAEQIKVEFMREDGTEPQYMHTYCWHCGNKIDWEEGGTSD